MASKKSSRSSREELSHNALEELMVRGKQRGFVTEDEIIHILPDIEQDLDSLENLYEQLETSGIRIVGSEEMLKVGEDKEVVPEKGKKKDKMMDLGESDDLTSVAIAFDCGEALAVFVHQARKAIGACTATLGGVDWSEFPLALDDIDRIEVISGLVEVDGFLTLR